MSSSLDLTFSPEFAFSRQSTLPSNSASSNPGSSNSTNSSPQPTNPTGNPEIDFSRLILDPEFAFSRQSTHPSNAPSSNPGSSNSTNSSHQSPGLTGNPELDLVLNPKFAFAFRSAHPNNAPSSKMSDTRNFSNQTFNASLTPHGGLTINGGVVNGNITIQNTYIQTGNFVHNVTTVNGRPIGNNSQTPQSGLGRIQN